MTFLPVRDRVNNRAGHLGLGIRVGRKSGRRDGRRGMPVSGLL